jgi:hypothetical protein
MEKPIATEHILAQMELRAEWEARLFAIVATLIANNVFEWADFRARLVRLNCSQSDNPDEEKLSTDLLLWAFALRNLLQERGLLP